MLCVNSYQQNYIDACRARMETQIAAYRALAKADAEAATVVVTGSFHTVGDAMSRLQVSPTAG